MCTDADIAGSARRPAATGLSRPAAAAGLAVVVALAAVGAYRAVYHTSDFRGFYEPARDLVRSGLVPTDRYPPTFHLMLAPLGLLPLWAAAILWQALNVAALVVLPSLLTRLTSVRPDRQVLAWVVVLPFLWDNLVLGQNGPLLLLAVSAAVLWIRDRKAVRGGAVLAAAALFKVLPGALGLIPAALGRRKGTLLGAAAAGASAAAVLVGVFGLEASTAWVGRWVCEVAQRESGRGMLENMHAMRYNNQSLLATLGRTFADISPAEAGGSTRIASLSLSAIAAINAAAVLVVLSSAVVACVRARRLPSHRAWAGLFALTALLLLLVSPLVWTHYFLWWLPALTYLRRRRFLLVAVGIVSAAALCSVTARGLGAHLLITLVLYCTVVAEILRRSAARPDTQSSCSGQQTKAPAARAGDAMLAGG